MIKIIVTITTHTKTFKCGKERIKSLRKPGRSSPNHSSLFSRRQHGTQQNSGQQTAKQHLLQAANCLGKQREETTWRENYNSHYSPRHRDPSVFPLLPPALSCPLLSNRHQSGPGA